MGVTLALQANDGYILELTILELYGMSAASWMARLLLVLLSWLRMGILFCLLRGCSVFGGWTRFVSLLLRVMLKRLWFGLGEARDLDRLGNNRADEAADFRRRRVPWWIIDAQRNCSGVCARWRPVFLGLHRFLVAIARAVVNHDGGTGTSMDPMVWSVGSALERRRRWVVVAATPITCHDIELWPYSVSMLVKWVAFLGTLHWPLGGVDLGVGVFLMWRCSFCMSSGLVSGWIWRRQFPGTVGQVAQFQCWLFLLVQALIFGDLAGTLVRYFVLLLHCLVVFVGSSLVRLVPITVGFGTLGGKGVVMASLPGLVNRLRRVFE